MFSRSRRLVYNLVGGKREAYWWSPNAQLLYIFWDHEGRLAPGPTSHFFNILRTLCASVDPMAVEMLADEAIGVEAAKERTLLESRLGGTRNNRVFAFFEIEAPRRAADVRLAEAEEKKKAKVDPSGAAGGKRKTASKGIGSTGALERKKTQDWRCGGAC